MTEFGYDEYCPTCGHKLKPEFITGERIITWCENCGEVEVKA